MDRQLHSSNSNVVFFILVLGVVVFTSLLQSKSLAEAAVSDGSDDVDTQSDTQPVHHLAMFKGCRSRADVVECFQTCWDEYKVSSTFRAAIQLKGKRVNITEFMWKRYNTTGKKQHRFGCLVGCLTNIPRALCKAKCTPPLRHFIGEDCIHNTSKTPPNFLMPGTNLISDDFRGCVLAVINAKIQEIPISLCDRKTALHDKRTVEEKRETCSATVDDCFTKLNLGDPASITLDNFELCVEYQLMEEHLALVRHSNYCVDYFAPVRRPDPPDPVVVDPDPGSVTTQATTTTTASNATTESVTTSATSTTTASTTTEAATKTTNASSVTEPSTASTAAPVVGPVVNPPIPPPQIPQSSPEDLLKGKCDMELIKNYLPNESCEEMCDIISPSTQFDKCVQTCDELTHPLCYEACVTDVRCFKACLEGENAIGTIGGTTPNTLHCFAYCNGDYEQMHEVWIDQSTKITVKQELALKCKKNPSSAEIEKLAKEAIPDEEVRKLVFENYNVDDYEWLFTMKLPEECENDCGGEPVDHMHECLRDHGCVGNLTLETRDKLCDDNPLRIFVHVQYAASKELSLKQSEVNKTYYRDPNTTSDYLFNPNDTARTSKFIQLMNFVREETDCDPNCPNNDNVGIANSDCAIKCFREHREKCEYDQLKNVDLTDFSTCQWLINLAYTSDPKDILGTYFNDKASYDEKDKLERPETTQFLQQTTLRENGSTGYFVFPYFIIIRATCDEGNYDDAFYRLLMSGTYPAVTVSYHPHTARDVYQSPLVTVFESTLINLKRTSDDILVPTNPLDGRREDDLSQDDIIEDWCHLKMCYPAFAIPHPMYQLPIFEVEIDAQNVFERLAHHVFVTSFHLTSATGSGELYVSDAHENVVSVATARDFFPKNRITQVEDASLADREEFCRNHPNTCPPIEDDEEDAHIDHEDILEAHFTYPSTPQIAIAGFYSPNLLIIGDPDMTKFDLVNWTIPTKKHNVPLFGEDHPCVFPKKYTDPLTGVSLLTTMPMYSKFDHSDPEYPIVYYRARYQPKNYAKTPNGHGIFDVIALQDRFLLITANGLVSIYGNTNDTLSAQKAFKVEASEKLKKCFKFMRTARVSQTFSDIVIGVTYTYDYLNRSSPNEDENKQKEHTDYIRQEIWYGRLAKNGEGLGWTQLKSSPNAAEDEDVEYSIPSEEDSGSIVPLVPGKPFRPPPLNSDSLSEVELICFKVYKEKISMKDVHINRFLDGWCEALDATPVVTRKDTIQLLIRMTVMYNGIGSSGSGTKVVLYVIATHTVDGEKKSNRNEKVLWIIDSIIPRVPCINEHQESVKNLMVFDNQYFTTISPGSNGSGFNYGCHSIFNTSEFRDYMVYVNRITYTATYTNHMFLYGGKLIHSTDGGKSFVTNTEFPSLDMSNNKKLKNRSHRIITMAFGQTGQFAFLTNERELWIGNTGTTELIRLRPSVGYYATQAIVSHKRGLQDGVSFALLYEHSEELFEMVALPGSDGKIESILKRQVPVSLILKQKHLQDQVEIARDFVRNIARTSDKPRRKFYDFSIKTDSQWHLYCPFSSPFFRENYTKKYSRDQTFTFSPPDQHPALSNYTRNLEFRSLIAYQVVSFGLTWKSFFDISYSAYARVEWEPFDMFKREKMENSSIGELRYRSIGREDNDREEISERAKTDGILLFPHHYSRALSDEESHAVQKAYYLDYGKVLLIRLKFSIKNPSSLSNTDYFTQHISDIQMNVDSGNGSLLLIDTERTVSGIEASVEFRILVRVIKSHKLPLEQNAPGKNLIPVPVLFHFIGAFGYCVQTPEDRLVKDTLRTTVYVGCLPGTDLLFNWNATLSSIKFRDKKKHYGMGADCYENALVCFFARLPMIFFFDVYDIAKQSYVPYTGNYIMRVVGGGYSNKTIKSYDKQEIDAYNIPGVSDVSLIWNEWDLTKQKKVDRQSNMWTDQEGHGKARIKDASKEIILTSGKSAVQWACHTLSPCARVAPNIDMQAVYWFEIQVTNKDVDNSTLCLFNKKFTIMLYGFPPSPETQLLTTILFCLGMIGILYLLFICLRGHKRVWRTTKIKLYGWYQIVKDTFPKPLKKHQAEIHTLGHTQEEKDNILLSLQGHLKIPPLVGRADSGGASPRSMASGAASPLGRKYKRDGHLGSGNSMASSEASIDSRLSRSQLEILNPVAARHGPATWTDMVYEQIIAKRLSAIVDKNNKMRQNILRRVSIHDATVEHEGNYEKHHKRTISQESIFAQPK